MDHHITNPIIEVDGVRYCFMWQSSYMGEIDYMVSVGNEPARRCSLRHRLDDFERSQLNYSVEGIVREVESAIGVLTNCDAVTVAAFNAWRERERRAMLEFMRARPERYGDVSDIDEIPTPARAAVFDLESRSWKDLA